MDIDLIALAATLYPQLPAVLVSVGALVTAATGVVSAIRLTLPALSWLSAQTATDWDDEAVSTLRAALDAVYDMLDSASGWFEPLSLVRRPPE